MNEYMPTDKQYNGQLIDEYKRLENIYLIAKTENSTETMRAIKKEMEYIKIKLQPIELPDLPE